MIELAHLTKIFNRGKSNEFKALKDIGLEIQAKRMTLFMGPSGSGKTTLLSIIGCVARPTTGRIWFNGQETTSLPERFSAQLRRSAFGFIFQSHHLIRGLTVLENTMIPAYPTGRRHREITASAMAILDSLGIASKASEKIEHMSGGEQQRAAVARALINDPAVIIADEPTAHLDTDRARSLMGILNRLKDQGKTILISSHDPLIPEVGSIDHTVTLRDGTVVSEVKGQKC